MPDEFPTLEAALSVSILVLGWRLRLLMRALTRVGAGNVRRAADPRRDPADWQRSSRRAIRARGRVGTDLVIAAVLGGALIYARAAGFDVRTALSALGAIAFCLLLWSAVLHARIARLSAAHLAELGPPLDSEDAASPAERPTAHPARSNGACPECGSSRRRSLTATDALGVRLLALGVEPASLCPDCGHLEGRVRSGTW